MIESVRVGDLVTTGHALAAVVPIIAAVERTAMMVPV
jgi:hypothetical protein